MLALLLAGCAGPFVMTGYVARDGEGVEGLPVEGAGLTALTDPDGRFELEPGDLPVPVTVVDGERAVSELSCAEHPVLELGDPVERAEATLALILRNVQGRPSFYVRYAAIEGTAREPVSRQWDVAQPVMTDEGRGVWTGQLQVPVSRAWVVGVSTLLDVSDAVGGHAEVGQALLATGDALADGEVRYVDVIMSDETLRETVYWDASGPGGVEEARLYQTIAVGDLEVDLLTWRGSIEAPAPVPIILRREGDPLIGVRAELTYGPTDVCVGREVGMAGALRAGRIDGRWVEGGVPGQRVAVQVLSFPEPYPEPPELTIGDGDRPDLTWSYVPARDAVVSFGLRSGAARWDGAGEVGCVDDVVAWPAALPARAGRRVAGALTWTSAGAWGRCEVDQGGR